MSESAKSILSDEVKRQLLPALFEMGFELDAAIQNNGKASSGAQASHWALIRQVSGQKALGLVITVAARPGDYLSVEALRLDGRATSGSLEKKYPLQKRQTVSHLPLSILSPLDHLPIETALSRSASQNQRSLRGFVAGSALYIYYAFETLVKFVTIAILGPTKGFNWIFAHPGSSASKTRQAWIVQRTINRIRASFEAKIPAYLND